MFYVLLLVIFVVQKNNLDFLLSLEINVLKVLNGLLLVLVVLLLVKLAMVLI